MTTIILAWDQPHLAETYTPNTGSVRFTPTRRHWHGDAVVPVESVRAIVDGTAKVELAPSSPGWCWRVSWHPVGGSGWSDHVLVPESETPIQYRDLVHVDPASLEPTATPDPAWVAEVEAIKEMGGVPGRSAYEEAVHQGYVGTEAEWLASLEGPAGPPGEPGPQGEPGPAGDVDALWIALEGEPGSPHYAPLSTALVEEYDENVGSLSRVVSIAEQLSGVSRSGNTLLVWGPESARTRPEVEQAEADGSRVLRAPLGMVAGWALDEASAAARGLPGFHPAFISMPSGAPAQVIAYPQQMPDGEVQYRYEIAPATKVEVTEIEGVPTLRVIPYQEAIGYSGEYYTVPLTRHEGPVPSAPA